MKQNLCLIIYVAVFLTGCGKTDLSLKEEGLIQTTADQLNLSAAKVKISPGPINFTAPNIFPEGLVYDAFSDRFLVSSVSAGTIGSVSRQGVYTPFIEDASLVSTVGMKIDHAYRRLLVTNASLDGALAQLAIYDLNTRQRLYLIDLAAVANDGAPHLVNDLTIDKQGNAYVTDSYAGIIYRVDRSGNAIVFYRNAAFTPPPGTFGFNGIVHSNSNGGYLLVAHLEFNQIIKIPVDNPAAFNMVQLSPAVFSVDGLLLSKDSKELIVVNNNGDMPGSKVQSFTSGDNWQTGSATNELNTGIVFPTTVASDGKTQYVLYSYINFFFIGQQRETFTIQPLPFSSNHPY